MPALCFVSLGCSALTAAILWGMGVPAEISVVLFALGTPGYWIYFAKRLGGRRTS